MVGHIELIDAQLRHGEGFDFKGLELRAVDGRPPDSEPLNGQGTDGTSADRTCTNGTRGDGNGTSSAGSKSNCEPQRPRLKYLLHTPGFPTPARACGAPRSGVTR